MSASNDPRLVEQSSVRPDGTPLFEFDPLTAPPARVIAALSSAVTNDEGHSAADLDALGKRLQQWMLNNIGARNVDVLTDFSDRLASMLYWQRRESDLPEASVLERLEMRLAVLGSFAETYCETGTLARSIPLLAGRNGEPLLRALTIARDGALDTNAIVSAGIAKDIPAAETLLCHLQELALVTVEAPVVLTRHGRETLDHLDPQLPQDLRAYAEPARVVPSSESSSALVKHEPPQLTTDITTLRPIIDAALRRFTPHEIILSASEDGVNGMELYMELEARLEIQDGTLISRAFPKAVNVPIYLDPQDAVGPFKEWYDNGLVDEPSVINHRCFAAHRRSPNSPKAVLQEGPTGTVLLDLGFTLGSVITQQCADRVTETAKAYAFMLLWKETVELLGAHQFTAAELAAATPGPAEPENLAAFTFVKKYEAAGVPLSDLYANLALGKLVVSEEAIPVTVKRKSEATSDGAASEG